MSMIKCATIILIENGLVLAVSRGTNLNDWGLPGGKLEPNELFPEAAVRECEEETGLTPETLKYAHSDTLQNKYIVRTFKGESYTGTLTSSSEGTAKWIEPALLCKGSYGTYNRIALQKVGIVVDGS